MIARRSPGFTMIEVILAFAIAAMLVTMVSVTVTALQASARRQKRAAGIEARSFRFEEILRRDLRGWIVVEGEHGAAPQPTAGGDEVLLAFRTTADALSDSADGQQKFQAARSTQVLYRLRRLGAGFQITREEQAPQGSVTELPLLGVAQPPKVELLRDGAWGSAEPQDPKRPEAARISLATRVILVRLHS